MTLQVDRTVDLIQIRTAKGYVKDVTVMADGRYSFGGSQQQQYPEKALRELVANAIVHRSYSVSD